MIGKTISHYKILEKFGEGGMGIVYKAQDTKLDRTVALKFLPPDLTRDPEAKERFIREAKAASTLQHNNICTIHDIDEMPDGQIFIVMDCYEGETLKEKIKRGPLKIEEAVDISMQIAQGLDEARKHKIIHRDIKPANVLITTNGITKIVDFGLAKLLGRTVLTKAGTTVGTVAYMSPEQAKGEEVDHRTDIWSLGVVLYEMITGQLPFKGEYDKAVIYSILNEEPEPVTGLRTGITIELEQIITKALEKEPDNRYQYIKDMFVDLKRSRRDLDKVSRKLTMPSPEIADAEKRDTKKRSGKSYNRFALPAIVLSIVIFAVGSIFFKLLSRKPTGSLKIQPFTSLPGAEYDPAFSPDGKQIAFRWTGYQNDNSDIYVKIIGTTDQQRLTTHQGPDYSPLWSPDGNSIAFISDREGEWGIYLISARGTEERKLFPIDMNKDTSHMLLNDFSWSPDGKKLVISIQRNQEQPARLIRFDMDNNEVDTLTTPAKNERDFSPVFSPDGRTLAFARYVSDISADIYLLSCLDLKLKRLTFNHVRIMGLTWTRDGNEVIFSSRKSGVNNNLWRVRKSGGQPVPVFASTENAQSPSISPQGNLLAFVKETIDRNLYRLDIAKSFKIEKGPIMISSSSLEENDGDISPDGTKIVFRSTRSGSFEIWVSDIDGQKAHPLTSLNPNRLGSPSWSPDGQAIVFDCNIDGPDDIYIISKDGGSPKRLTTDKASDNVPRWSRDGQWIYFYSDMTGRQEIWKMSRNGENPEQITKNGGFLGYESEDGRWFYYSKRNELGIWRIPIAGGEEEKFIVDRIHWKNWILVGDGIYYQRDSSPPIRFEYRNLKTGKVTKLAEIQGDNLSGNYIDLSPDRSWILFTKMEPVESDIMLVENFR